MNGNIMAYPKTRTVGDIGGDLIMLGVVGVVGYFLVSKLGGLFSGSGSGVDPATTTAAQATAVQQAQQQAQTQGLAAATYTSDQYTGFANQIFTLATATSGGIPDDTQTQIRNIVIEMNSMVDLQNLIAAFGVRKANCALLGFGCTNYDLPSFLRAGLSPDQINTINGYLSNQGINYQF